MQPITPLPQGAQAPDFSLLDQNGETIRLSSLPGGKVLVYFYPKAMTPGCTTQACGLRDVNAELAALGVTVLGISPDPVARLKKFELRDDLNFRLLSDEDHQVAEAFGVWGEKQFMGRVSNGIHRLSFLLDEHGVVLQRFDKFKTADHHRVVLEYLQGR